MGSDYPISNSIFWPPHEIPAIFPFVRSFVRACVRACVRSFVRPFVRSFIEFIHSFTQDIQENIVLMTSMNVLRLSTGAVNTCVITIREATLAPVTPDTEWTEKNATVRTTKRYIVLTIIMNNNILWLTIFLFFRECNNFNRKDRLV